MELVLTLSICWIVAAIRLGTISPLRIHATLTSRRIIVLLENLDFLRSINDLSTMLQTNRLGFSREYIMALRGNPELLDDISQAVAIHSNIQKDHRLRNRLFNYHLLAFINVEVNYRNVGLSYESMKDILKPTMSELLHMNGEEEILQMSKATYLALDYLQFVVASFATVSEYDIILEALIRVRFILIHLIDELPDKFNKNIRQLRYFQWSLLSSLEARPTLPLRKIRAYYCEIFKDFEIEKRLCDDEPELKSMYQEAEQDIWDVDVPGRLKNLAQTHKYQKELTKKCDVQMIHMLNSPETVTDKIAKQVLETCANGLICEDTFVKMINVLITQSKLSLSFILTDALLSNTHDIKSVHRKLSKFLNFSCDHKATELAIQASISEKRGFLIPMNHVDVRMSEMFKGQSIATIRQLVMDQLEVHTNIMFNESKPSGETMKLISDIAVLAIRLRVSLKGWWRSLCNVQRPVSIVKPAHLVMSLIAAPISEIIGTNFTIRDIYSALLENSGAKITKS